jgi:hypothetical protein
MLTACMGPEAAADRMVASPDPTGILAVTAANEGDGCSLMVGGQRLTSEQFTELAMAWPSRRVALTMAPQTKYRCAGGIIFTLQRYGFEGQVIDAESGRQFPLARRY